MSEAKEPRRWWIVDETDLYDSHRNALSEQQHREQYGFSSILEVIEAEPMERKVRKLEQKIYDLTGSSVHKEEQIRKLHQENERLKYYTIPGYEVGIKELTEALEFYANELFWLRAKVEGRWDISFGDDNGKRARKALGKGDE